MQFNKHNEFSKQNSAVDIKPASRNLLLLRMWDLDSCR